MRGCPWASILPFVCTLALASCGARTQVLDGSPVEVASVDATASATDAGVRLSDAGVTPPDSGVYADDAGVDALDAGSVERDTGVDAAVGGDGGCGVAPLGGIEVPPWYTRSCFDGGCPSGSVCVSERGPVSFLQAGCAPIPERCGREASCTCMGCVCGKEACSADDAGLVCQSLAP
jgi:hypothetical protein